MTYALHFCQALNIFRLDCYTDNSSVTKTEAQLRKEFTGDETLLAWLEFAKQNPNKDCVFAMLPA